MLRQIGSWLLCALSVNLFTPCGAYEGMLHTAERKTLGNFSLNFRPSNWFAPVRLSSEPIVFEYRPTNPAGEPIVFEYKPTNPAGEPIVFEYKPTNPAGEPIVFEYKPTNPAGEPIVFEYKPTNPAGEPIVFEYKPTNPAGEPIVFEYGGNPGSVLPDLALMRSQDAQITFEKVLPTQAMNGHFRQLPVNPGQPNIAQVDQVGYVKAPSSAIFNTIANLGFSAPNTAGMHSSRIGAQTFQAVLPTAAFAGLPMPIGVSLTTSVPTVPTSTMTFSNSVSGISTLSSGGSAVITPVGPSPISGVSMSGVVSGGSFSTQQSGGGVSGANGFKGSGATQFGTSFTGFSK